MKTIDINTTQNVTIQYALASTMDRLLAFVIDALILFAVIFVVAFLAGTLFPRISGYILFVLLAPFFFFYSLLSELLMNGQSTGKKMMGLKVVSVSGKECTPNEYMIRWAFRFIDIWFSLGSLSILLISSTSRSQRLGDLMANTTVIKLNPWASVRLQDILAIKTTENYQVSYPDIRGFSENDILLIKQVTDRANRYRNPAHAKAVAELCEKMAGELGITPPENRMDFLKTLVRDYVVLSR